MRGSFGRLLAAVASSGLLAWVAATATASPAAPSDPWKAAAARLSMPVYRPTVTLGLRVAYVNPILADPGCINDGRDQLRAVYYGRKAGRYVEVLEGHPRYCLDQAVDAPVVRRAKIGGRPATIHDLCGKRDCQGAVGGYAVDWCMRGTTITVVGIDFRPDELLRFARSMRPVDSARALRCVSG